MKLGLRTHLLLVRQLLAEQTPQPGGLRALQRDSDARVPVADLLLARAAERQEQRVDHHDESASFVADHQVALGHFTSKH